MVYGKRIILACLLALVISLLVNGFDIYANYQAVSPNGSQGPLWSVIFLAGLPLLAVIFVLLPASLIGLIFKSSRRTSFIILLCSIIYFGTAIVCLRLSDKVRMAAFHKLSKRSEPLVNAIKTYESKYGTPPASLEGLVPDFLPKLPQTGMGAYPEYQYKVGQEAQEFAQDEWCLVIGTPSGGINFDIFIYFPNQNYPEHGYGGVLERTGDWAYVHE